jgi:iron complex outermembrane receptor protein
MRPSKTLSLRFAALALVVWVAAMDAASAQDTARKYRIAEQSLGQALREFALASNLDLLFSPELVAGKKSPSLDGKFTVDEGLRTLLRGSGLEFSVSGSRVVISEAKPDPARQATSQMQSTNGYTRLAQAEGTPFQSSSEASEPSTRALMELEEILVTAQKRIERLQDVPVPVTAVSANTLVESNRFRLQDYYTRVPGLSVVTSNYGPPMVAIRGIASGGLGINPTVAMVVDDVPLGPSMREAFGPEVPEMDPSDLARIEVLRGPQGTLYGASSIGGLVKFVTVDPSTDRLSAHLQGGFSGVRNGDELGYNLRGSLNIPFGDSLAVRASAFTRRDPGYIDDPVHGIEGVNRGESHGGRLSALWKPTESLSLKLGALVHDTETHGSSEINVRPGLEDLQQNKIPGTGGHERKFELYSATLNADLGRAALTSVTGYSETTKLTSADDTASAFFVGLTRARFGVSGFEFQNDLTTRKFSQELRLSFGTGESLEWLIGGYYSDEDTQLGQDWLARDFNTGTVAGSLFHADNPLEYSEYAAFADATYHFTDRFDVQLGAREAWTRKSLAKTQSGFYVQNFLGGVASLPETLSTEDSFTYLVTPRFRISSDLMIYARIASGYRPGGPNINCAVLTQPCEYSPDTTTNYELGIKGSALDRALTFDASIYHIDWKDIQILVLDPAVSASVYTDNGSRAKSQGAEIALELRPWSGASISVLGSLNRAVLTEPFPAAAARLSYGMRGTRLPFSARFSGAFAVNQDFPLSPRVAGFVSASLSYVGDRFSTFAASATAPRQRFPSYNTIDIGAGVRADIWSANLYLNNLADKRGVLFGGVGHFDATSFSYIQPRNIGLSITRTFE